MIAEIAKEFSGLILLAGATQEAFGIGQQWDKGNGIVELAIYPDAEAVTINFDNYDSVAFFLLNGPVQVQQLDSEVSGCGIMIRKKYPLRCVVFASTNPNIHCDPFNEGLANNIIAAITFQDNALLSSQFKLMTLTSALVSQEFRRDEVWRQLRMTQGLSEVRDEQALFTIDIEVTAEGLPGCWVVKCAVPLTTEGGEGEEEEIVLEQTSGDLQKIITLLQ